MQRRSRTGSWRKFALQLGALVGGAAALTTGGAPTVAAAPFCPPEAVCGLLKPLLFFVVDASTAMNEPYNFYKSRWEMASVMIAQAIGADNGWLASQFQLGLIRFGHDPDPAVPGTPIAGDASGLVDGHSLDVLPYDPLDPPHPYADCTSGQAILDVLVALPPPLNGLKEGIRPWTRGGLEFARATLEKADADHPGEAGARPKALVLITGGPWTDAPGEQILAPPAEDPAITAGGLWTDLGVPTYVVTLGDAVDAPFADTLAAAGGTGVPLPVPCGPAPESPLAPILDHLGDTVTQAPCGDGYPRLMLLLDASSSMLNINNGTQAGPMGATGWDQARDALTGPSSLFDVPVGAPQMALDERVLVGLAAFGHNNPAPGEQKLVVDYGPCHQFNVAWALDPTTSCALPGCTDPWGGPPITWTFQDGSQIDPPIFSEKTISHMPRCDFAAQLPDACVGSGTYTHLGLQLVQQNLAAHRAACEQPEALYPCSDATRFVNILVTDGNYVSTDPQVQGPLEQMFVDGVTTHIIGFGDAPNPAQLALMADWGSGGALAHYDANNQLQLEAALAAIVEAEFIGLGLDPCCGTFGCNILPEPTTSEPDPVPETEGPPPICGPWDESSTGSTSETGSSSTTTGDSSTGDSSTGDSSTGDSSTTGSSSSTTGTPPTTGAVTTGAGPDGSSSGDSSEGAATAAPPGGGDGCGCATSRRTGDAAWLGLALLALSRRRRRMT